MKTNSCARGLALLLACSGAAWAQSPPYPSKTIRIIVPFAPAGPTDNQARWAAQQLNAAFGQPVIVDNRPGAGGVPGTEAVVKSAPDGYTLLAGNPGPLTIAPTVRAQMPYDTLRDLAPIMLIAKSASCLCAHPSLPAKGVKEFVALARARPGAINYGTPGVGTVGHLATELFATEAGVKLNHVPYKGAAQYTVDLLAGNIEIALNQFAIVGAAGEPGQAALPRRHFARTHAAHARSADDRRAGTEGIRELQLERHARAGRHAESHHRRAYTTSCRKRSRRPRRASFS